MEDETEEMEFLRKRDTDLLAPCMRRECWDRATESVVPTDVVERMDSTSMSRRLRSGERELEGSPLLLRLPSDSCVVAGWSRAGCWRRRVSVVSSSPLNASISRRPSASTSSIARRISWAVWRFSSLKTSCKCAGGGGFEPASALGRRPGKEEGGVAVARRRKLRVVDRDMLHAGLKLWSVALFGIEL